LEAQGKGFQPLFCESSSFQKDQLGGCYTTGGNLTGGNMTQGFKKGGKKRA